MKILLVNKFHYRKGGAETYYLTVGSELERMGHEVAYFSMKHPNNLPCKWDKYFVTQREYNDVKNPLSAVRDGIALIYSPGAKRNFQALCEEFRPDVVHLNNVHRQITLSILDAPYLKEHHVPVFYTAHDYVTVCPGYLMLDGEGRVCDACLEDGKYRHCIENRCVKGSRAKSALAAFEASFNRAHHSNERIDRVIAPSRFMRSKLIEGGWPEGKVEALQNFADDAILARASGVADDVTDRESPYLLFFGRLSAEKGVDVLLRAFDAAAPSLPRDMRLIVVGDGPDAAEFRELAESLYSAPRIEFAGYQTGDALQIYVERASLAIASSRCRENMPYSIVEAFAAGTPVVGTRIGGIPELVTDGVTGFACEPGDVATMADAMVRGAEAFLDAPVYVRMQESCRAYVRENCSRDKFMDQLVKLYEEAVNG
ncbi:N-acetyl-alpha-D-glucosaminyl L-malate synthase [Collinsella intestinalis]|uniref:N-acetyl-alpha-D-glucosaminyl L-malate synthase n=1 Tax=Collinsella intestinalis TaxID=147207 RepID=A0A5K1ITN3_9ACTN|nr:glycosyltransferase family 4 protein [Collinsella intestinalis]VWL92306.1 N-acetyl-alpha-D-glucosaminyl L-malate synthase [Collinsella intestinalis]